MVEVDKPPEAAGQYGAAGQALPRSVSLVIVGGGIMGLWAAVAAARRGIDTLLVDEGMIGGGASGGFLGALLPHMPDRWSAKKQFQFDALLSLEKEIARLEEQTGLSAGYRRSGRIVPLPKPHLRAIAERHEKDARVNWRGVDHAYHWHVLDAPPVGGWVDPAAGQAGFVHDTFAARVSPRSLIAVLKSFLKTIGCVRLVEQCGVVRLDGAKGEALLTTGERLGFGHAVVSAGHRSFPMLGAALGAAAPKGALGQPVKGQAARLEAGVDPALPVIFLNGLYIVPHEDGTVAVGSTSEDVFEAPLTTDARLDALVEEARRIVPALKRAAVIERWAGLRPKAVGRDAMVGSHPDQPRLIALTGGFKVSFGLAHRLAEAAVNLSLNAEVDIPSGFSLNDHIFVAKTNI